MGVGADSTNKAFHAQDINNLLKRPGMVIYRDEMEYNDRDNTNHVVVAVDPCGGGASAFAVASVVQQPNGSIVVRYSRPRPITQRLTPPHLTQHHTHGHKRVRTLARVPEEARCHKGQHALNQVLGEGRLISRVDDTFLCGEVPKHLGLLAQCKEHRRALTRRLVLSCRKRRDAVDLGRGLFCCWACAIHLLDERT